MSTATKQPEKPVFYNIAPNKEVLEAQAKLVKDPLAGRLMGSWVHKSLYERDTPILEVHVNEKIIHVRRESDLGTQIQILSEPTQTRS